MKFVGIGLVSVALAAAGCGGSEDDHLMWLRLNGACFRGGEPTNFDFRDAKIVVTCTREDGRMYQVITDGNGFGAAEGHGE